MINNINSNIIIKHIDKAFVDSFVELNRIEIDFVEEQINKYPELRILKYVIESIFEITDDNKKTRFISDIILDFSKIISGEKKGFYWADEMDDYSDLIWEISIKCDNNTCAFSVNPLKCQQKFNERYDVACSILEAKELFVKINQLIN